MKTEVTEGICVPVTGEEEDYLQFLDAERRTIGAAGLLSVDQIPCDLANAFEHPDDEYWAERIREYRAHTGREFPPTYRVKVTVEVELVPDKEAAELWRAFRQEA